MNANIIPWRFYVNDFKNCGYSAPPLGTIPDKVGYKTGENALFLMTTTMISDYQYDFECFFLFGIIFRFDLMKLLNRGV